MDSHRSRWSVAILCATAIAAATAIPAAATDPAPIPFRPAGISTDRFPVATTPQVVELTAPDGVLIHSRVYRPDTSSDPSWLTPVILIQSPYFGNVLEPAIEPLSPRYAPDIIETFTPKGYTVVLSDVRGTGRSGGCFDDSGLLQGGDFAMLVEHFAGEPWTNGKVGGFGQSYDAETQNAGAIQQPEGLETIVPVSGLTSYYRYFFYDGVPFLTQPTTASAAFYAAQNTVPWEPTWIGDRLYCQPARFEEAASQSGDMTAWLAEREFVDHVHDVQASVLFVQGFPDRNVAPTNIPGWLDELPTFTRAILGQFGHVFPGGDVIQGAPDEWARNDWLDMLHAWYDHELLDLPTGIESWPVVQVQDETNVWRAEPSFESLGEERAWPLGGATLGTAGNPGQAVSFSEMSPGATWTSEPVEDALHLSGQVFLDAAIELDRSDAHFMMLVDEILADGSERPLAVGYLSARHRNGIRSPSPVPTGDLVEYRIQSLPFDKWVSEGSRLRLTLRGIDDGTNPEGVSFDPSGAMTPAGTAYTAEVYVDGRSALELPVVTDECGIDVDSVMPPSRPVPDC